ncbi:phage tail sheath family protein [Draconibacterium sp. IB214405]|uniref:phage tail sheath family protein n=1 Tax=Draconibacterium sp. IB214405 TaxID=3097352 RepID=UPI002A0BD8A1|nr:phage tail sheath family protein [Draconibacterium sp. IB214405]MDX8339941.1 phage tail sheath family protein [Draconibacterium sp. IB214405]
MATYKTPGVYVEEISVFPPSVAQVETAIPAFIGYTEKAKRLVDDDLLNVPTRITSLLEYKQLFGGANPEENIAVNISDVYDTAGNLSRTIQVPDPTTKSPFLMYYSMQLYFANGGGPCYIVSVGDYSGSVSKATLGSNGGLALVAKEDEPTLIVFPDATNVSTVTNFYDLYEEAMTQCHDLQDRFTIIDSFNQAASFADTLRTNISLGTDYLKYGAAYYPWLKTTLPYAFDEADVTIAHTESGAPGGTVSYDTLAVNDSTVTANTELYNLIKLELAKLTVTLPPSSAMAGIYARVDSNRGVWKAPANVGVMSIVGPDKKVTNLEQDGLNMDTSGKSINAIRTFAGKGTLVWGARTLAGNDNEWKYIPVRRFFNMVEESVKKATSQFVFEPNDANTWVKVRAMIENFLTLQWRDGALAGAKAEDAFFVKVGLGQTMTAQDILEGRMNVEIGMAAVRPAEFIILKFSHKMQES